MSARDRITAEALKLFVQHGVAATTTRQIAAAAGIAEGTIYRHFKSKEELAQTLFERNYLAFAGYVERAAARATAGSEKVSRMLSWLALAAERDMDLFAFLFLTDHGLEARLRPDAVTPRHLIEEAVREVCPTEAPAYTSLLLGALLEAARARRRGALAKPLGDCAANLTRLTASLLGETVNTATPPPQIAPVATISAARPSLLLQPASLELE